MTCHSRWAVSLTLLVMAAIPLLTAGCENQVTAVTGTEKPFSLYGVLQPRADTQYVAVYPITEKLAPVRPESLDAQVTMEDVQTGVTYRLRDSTLRQETGRYVHAYWTARRADYAHTYRIRAENSDGRATTVEVTVPRNAELRVRTAEEKLGGGVIAPVFVDREVPRLQHVEVEYEIKYDRGETRYTTTEMTISYDGQQEKVDGGWVINVDLAEDFETLRGRLQERFLWSPRYRIALIEMTLRLAVVNESWNPPGGRFDPEVLVEPGTMSNVENGFGFVGAGYRLDTTWVPKDEALQAAGWRVLEGS